MPEDRPDQGTFEVRGYSERGMVNALLYEIRYSADPVSRLREVLGLCEFPNAEHKPDFGQTRDARVRIEQSFSDFGDLDILFLLDGASRRSVSLEAKVKTYLTRRWRIAAEWEAFVEMRKKVIPKSNLFIQLYRKMRLVRQAREPGRKLEADDVATRWSLGDNGIVREAAVELRPYAADPWFVALVPGSEQELRDFFGGLMGYAGDGLPDWTQEFVARCGFLTWGTLESFCKEHKRNWPETLANFEYNRGQIYEGEVAQASTPDRPPPPGCAVTWEKGPHGPIRGVVVRRGRHNTRIRLTNGQEEVVPHGELSW